MYHDITGLQEQLASFGITVYLDLGNEIVLPCSYDELPEPAQRILDNWASDNNVS